MIDYENKSKKVELYLHEQVEHDNIFTKKKEQIEEKLNESKNFMLESLNDSINSLKNPDIKTNKIAWSFRVLFNNLLFIGGLLTVSSMMGPPTTILKQNNLLVTTFSENGRTEYISPLKGIKNPILNAIIENDVTFFRKIEGINYNDKIYYQQNGKGLNISPLELAVIYDRKSLVEFMIKKQPALNVTPVSISQFHNPNNTNYNILTLPQVHDNEKTNNFGFESKSLLINKGMNIGFNNYEIFRKTINIPEWKTFWKNYFLQKNNMTLYKNLLMSELGDKKNLLNDIDKIN